VGRLNGAYGSELVPIWTPLSHTPTLVPGKPNLLVVRVDNFLNGSLPEDWWNWGGIVQPVTLQPVGRVQLQDLGVMPEVGCNYQCGDVLVQGTVTNVSGAPIRPSLTVTGTSPAGGSFSASHVVGTLRPGASAAVSFRVRVPGPLELWSPSNPALYQITVKTVVGPRVEQVDSLRIGMRSVQVSGGILYLNGQRLWLHGAAIQEDMPGHGAALTPLDIETIVSELRAVGANVTRAHYLLSDQLLDALDAAGIMVWSQAPVDHADAALGTAQGRSTALSLLRSTLIGDRNHPSVIVASVGNELSPTPTTTKGTGSYLSQAISLTRSLDPAAAVGLDIFCYPGYPMAPVYSKLDVLGISDYYGWYIGPPGHSIADFNGLEPYLEQIHSEYPSQAMAVSEFGAEALYDGPVTTKGTYEFQSSYLQQTFGVLDQLPFMNGAIYWTLREYAVNPGWVGGAVLPADDPPSGLSRKGLIGYFGNQKPAFSVARQLFADPPAYVQQAN
jgi:beta-glucuronidase